MTSQEPRARPIIRKLALGLAVACFLLGIVVAVTSGNSSQFSAIACLIVGFVMLTIAKTGLWPPPRGQWW